MERSAARTRTGLVVLGVWFAATSVAGAGELEPGHILVPQALPSNNALLQIDPATGQAEVFADFGASLSPLDVVLEPTGDLFVLASAALTVDRHLFRLSRDGLTFQEILTDADPDALRHVDGLDLHDGVLYFVRAGESVPGDGAIVMALDPDADPLSLETLLVESSFAPPVPFRVGDVEARDGTLLWSDPWHGLLFEVSIPSPTTVRSFPVDGNGDGLIPAAGGIARTSAKVYVSRASNLGLQDVWRLDHGTGAIETTLGVDLNQSTDLEIDPLADLLFSVDPLFDDLHVLPATGGTTTTYDVPQTRRIAVVPAGSSPAGVPSLPLRALLVPATGILAWAGRSLGRARRK